MTAPDSRDSVKRVVADMQHYVNGSTSLCPASVIDKWARRLQALARGPQQAGGEVAELLDWLRWLAGDKREVKALEQHYAALQAEVARLQRERDIYKAADESMQEDHHQALTRALAAEAALREAGRDAECGREIAAAFLPVMEAMRPLVLNLERLKDAASKEPR